MAQHRKHPGYLEGQLLIATPSLQGSCFSKSVVYICVHNAEGAMGIIVNQPLDQVNVNEVLKQLNIETGENYINLPVHFGGPVEVARGFVLHSSDYTHKGTVHMGNNISVTSNVDALRDIAAGKGPEHSILALGYAGWSPGQLEAEIEANSWITAPANGDIVFGASNQTKWELSAGSLGVHNIYHLSTQVGHA